MHPKKTAGADQKAGRDKEAERSSTPPTVDVSADPKAGQSEGGQQSPTPPTVGGTEDLNKGFLFPDDASMQEALKTPIGTQKTPDAPGLTPVRNLSHTIKRK